MPPSVAASGGAPQTTYGLLQSLGIPPPALLNKMLPMAEDDEAFVSSSGGMTPPPVTPAMGVDVLRAAYLLHAQPPPTGNLCYSS
jgi:hypothetical protein